MSSGYTLNGVTGVAGDGFTEMFYMQNYCWESFNSFPVKSVNISGEIIAVFDETRADEIKSLELLKVFPYVMMAYAALMFLPFLVWSRMFATKTRDQLDFLMGGMEEGLTMTIGGLAKSLDGYKGRRLERTTDEETVYQALAKELRKDPNLNEKFESYQKFLLTLAKSNRLSIGYSMRRWLHAIVSVTCTYFLFVTYVQEYQSSFNCLLNWTVSENGEKEVIRPAVLCSMQGVELVRLVVAIICALNAVLVPFYAIMAFYTWGETRKAIRTLQMLPSPVIIQYSEIYEAAESLKCSDLHTLLSLAKNSLRETHPTFAFCVQASKMARTLNGKKKKPDGDDDGGYLVMLKGLVAWGKKEAEDTKREAILKNLRHHGK